MNCQWQTGLLVVRECGLPATSGCGMCGRSLCMAHAVPGPAGMACPQCAATTQGYPSTEETELANTRGEYYQRYGAGTQYGQAGYFSPTDSAAMASRGPLPPGRMSEYDPMES